MNRATPVWVIFAAVAMACGDGGGKDHPVQSGYPYEANNRIGLHGSETDSALARLAIKIRSAPRIVTVGQLGGPQQLQFGGITDIQVDQHGRIFVLDSEAREIDAFDRTGAWLGLVSGPGPGPKELQSPVGIAMTSGDTLVILDRAAGVRLLDATLGDTFPQLSSWPTSPVPVSGCWLDGALVIRGNAIPGALQVRSYDLRGEAVDSMLPGYTAGNTLVQAGVSEGPLACDRTSHTIIAAFQLLPIVFGLNMDGSLRWGSELEGFAQSRITEGALNSAPSVTVGRAGEKVLSITPFPAGASLLQSVVIRPDSAPLLRSYLFRSESGKGYYLGDSLPAVMAADSTHFYGVWATQEEPWPRLVVHQYGPLR